MVNSSPPEPSSPPPRKPILDFDELVALIVAFGAIAAILFWGMTRKASVLTFSPDRLMGESSESTLLDKSLSALKEEQKASNLIAGKSEKGDRLIRKSDSQDAKQGVVSVLPALAWQQVLARPAESAAKPSNLEESPTDNPDNTPETSVPLSPVVPEKSPSATEQPDIEFSDLSEEYWANAAISALVGKGVVSGFPDGTFAPDRQATRAEFAVQLQKIFEQKASRNPIEFEDVSNDYWGAAGIDSAVKMGFLKGYPGGIFKPEETITRLQVLLALAAGLNLEPDSQPEKTLEIYKDASEIPPWATEAIAAATEAGLVANYPDLTTLNPDAPATRADVAVMIYQALARSGEFEELPSEYVIPARK